MPKYDVSVYGALVENVNVEPIDLLREFLRHVITDIRHWERSEDLHFDDR